jgi:hypothetical protein
MVGIFFHLELTICTTYCNKSLSAPSQDLLQPTLPARVAFTFAFEGGSLQPGDGGLGERGLTGEG